MASMSSMPPPRRAPRGLALLGLIALAPWGFLTMIEVDRGWEDAIWQYNPWRRDAIVLVWAGVIAAVAANGFAEARLRRLAWAALAAEIAAGVGWLVLLFATPS
jgi:hypothetical protein